MLFKVLSLTVFLGAIVGVRDTATPHSNLRSRYGIVAQKRYSESCAKPTPMGVSLVYYLIDAACLLKGLGMKVLGSIMFMSLGFKSG